mgnify:CR=1 FL=1
MKTALITGAGRREGLGFEVAHQLGNLGYHVILSARQPAQIDARVQTLRQAGIDASGILMDIADHKSVQQAAQTIQQQFQQLDVLINNAAVFGNFESLLETDMQELHHEFNTNFFGTWDVIQQFYPLLRQAGSSRIVNVSSGAGSFDDPKYGMVHGSLGMPVSAYALTKLSINGLTVKAAREFAPDGILVNSVCPGVVATHQAPGVFARPVPDGAKSVVWAATLPDDGPTGKFFRDGQPLPW